MQGELAVNFLKKFILIAVVILVFVFVVYYSTEFLLPFVLGILLSAVLEPLVSNLEKYGLARNGAVVIAILLVFAVMILFFVNFFPFIFEQLDILRKQLPTLEQKFRVWLNSLPFKKYDWFKSALAFAGNFIAEAPSAVLSQIPAILGNIAGILWNLILVPMIAFFILKDGWLMKKKMLEFVPNRYFEMAHSTFSRVELALGGFIRGILMEITVDSILAFILLSSFGSVFPAALAVVIGLFYIVPYIGPLMSLFVSIAVNYFSQGGISPLEVLLAVGIVQAVDNLLVYPLVVGRETKLHPLVIIASLIIGGKFMGFLGMIITVPVVAMTRAIFTSLYRGLSDYKLI